MFDMGRRDFITLLGGAAARGRSRRARSSRRCRWSGFSAAERLTRDDRVTAFRQGLKEAGFVEGQNVAIEYRSAEDQTDRLPLLVADLLRRQVALIVGNTPAALAAKAATTTVPIVFATGGDPVRVGLVANLNRPAATSPVSASSRWNLRRSSLGSCVSCGREPRALPCSSIPNSPLPSGLSQRSELRLRPLGSKSKSSTSAATAKSRPPLQRSSNVGLARCSWGTGEFLLSQRERIVALAARHGFPRSISRAITSRRRPDELRRQHYRCIPSSRHLCRTHPQRREAG